VASQCSGRSVVYLLKPIIALVVTPIDEHGPVIDAGAMLAPAFKPHMGCGQGGNGRSLPSEIALDPIGPEGHGGATVAVAVTSRFVLSRIPDIKDADGSYEVELRSADINVRAFLNELEGLVGGNKVVWGF